MIQNPKFNPQEGQQLWNSNTVNLSSNPLSRKWTILHQTPISLFNLHLADRAVLFNQTCVCHFAATFKRTKKLRSGFLESDSSSERTQGKLSAPQTGRTAPPELRCPAKRPAHSSLVGSHRAPRQPRLRVCVKKAPRFTHEAAPRMVRGATAARRARIAEQAGRRELLFEQVRRVLPLQKDATPAATGSSHSFKRTNDP